MDALPLLHELGVCAIGDSSNDTALAHEFGHLLLLEHQGDIRDLMNPGLAVPGAPLTKREIAIVRTSPLFIPTTKCATDRQRHPLR